MKKTVLTLTVIAFTGLALISCKKDRVCECVESPGNDTWKTTLKNVSKRQAKANCYDYEYEIMSTKVMVDCTIK
jgi:hypothetical protein